MNSNQQRPSYEGDTTNLAIGTHITRQANLRFVVYLKHYIVFSGAKDVVNGVAAVDTTIEAIYLRNMQCLILNW